MNHDIRSAKDGTIIYAFDMGERIKAGPPLLRARLNCRLYMIHAANVLLRRGKPLLLTTRRYFSAIIDYVLFSLEASNAFQNPILSPGVQTYIQLKLTVTPPLPLVLQGKQLRFEKTR